MDGYRPVRVATLMGGRKLDFDAYVKVGEKAVLYCRGGEDFSEDRYQRLISKSVKSLHIKSEHTYLYENYIKEGMQASFTQDSSKSIADKAQIIQGIMLAAGEDLIENLDSDSHHLVAVEASKSFHKFLQQETQALFHIFNLPNVDHGVSQHGVNVAAISLMVADTIGLSASMALKVPSFCIGAMIHDIEHMFNPVDLSVPPQNLSGEQKQIYNVHCENGFKRVQEITHFNEIVGQIIYQHDERMDGTGPLKLREKEVSPLVYVVAVADLFDKMVRQQKMPAKEILKILLVENMGKLPLDIMKSLQEVIKKSGLATQ